MCFVAGKTGSRRAKKVNDLPGSTNGGFWVSERRRTWGLGEAEFGLGGGLLLAVVQLVAPNHGGHCGFFQKTVSTEDRFWAENRILDFIVETKD